MHYMQVQLACASMEALGPHHSRYHLTYLLLRSKTLCYQHAILLVQYNAMGSSGMSWTEARSGAEVKVSGEKPETRGISETAIFFLLAFVH